MLPLFIGERLSQGTTHFHAVYAHFQKELEKQTARMNTCSYLQNQSEIKKKASSLTVKAKVLKQYISHRKLNGVRKSVIIIANPEVMLPLALFRRGKNALCCFSKQTIRTIEKSKRARDFCWHPSSVWNPDETLQDYSCYGNLVAWTLMISWPST